MTDCAYWVNIEGQTSPSLERLRQTLLALGWELTSKQAGRYEVWTLSGTSQPEVLLPLDPTRGDYEGLLLRAEQVLRDRYGTTLLGKVNR